MYRQSLKRSAVLVAILLTASGCSDRDSTDTDALKKDQANRRAATKVADKYAGLESFLDADEQAALMAVHEKHQNSLFAFHSEHGEKIRSGQEALIDFIGSRNKTKALTSIAKGKRDNVKELILEERAMQQEYEDAVLASVPQEKLRLWQAEQISRTLLDFLEPLRLSEVQVQQVYEIAPMALTSISSNEQRAWLLIGTSTLEKLFGQRIVSKDQRQKFEELQKKNKLRKLKWAF